MTTASQPLPLTGSERRYLRALAHHLKPIVQIGKAGLTPQVLTAIDHALNQHELIKVRFLDGKEQKQAVAQTIAQTSCSAFVGAVGHVCLFYRQHHDPEKRQIRLPAS